MDSVFGPTFAERKVLLSLCIEDSSLKKKYQGWIAPTLLGDESGVSASSAWAQVKKTVDFDRIREWLTFCNEHHLTDFRMQTLDKIPFFWLIDCATRSIINAPDQAVLQYVALSYCWGPLSGAPLDNPSELPPVAALVIEDALHVARELGIPYLWVDRYCVSQSVREIQAPQLQNTHKVYRSAYVTIIAGCGEDPDFGTTLPGVTIRYRKAQTSVQTHGHILTCIPDAQHDIQKCRWSTRGWTYQENLLSKRRLVFTESQVYFQCWNMHCSESTPLRLEQAHTKDLIRFKNSIHTLCVFPQKSIRKTSNEVVARIQEYLDRRFSQESDALNAFLGVYEAFKELEQPIYNFWGLPTRVANFTPRFSLRWLGR
ncbi:hypothetical protein SNOG_00577 [Parastagonospora nodorum SN15]|uniref:Heterokaryon incompatibility domain-containing protein n=1 Tax=Phaeosphaeria nodorum (strain SN15 / ATCC MYA-4574 / FGSC 10173) TaxID=321614 RepID=Q0V5Y7_PHANO|nr:hypothetical protein SNOG_00577 [Parastagonospora nodorum SN15]EAT92072.1 hypothetical protein SNOG_00577 [Parastagonospora nodorum SN15]